MTIHHQVKQTWSSLVEGAFLITLNGTLKNPNIVRVKMSSISYKCYSKTGDVVLYKRDPTQPHRLH